MKNLKRVIHAIIISAANFIGLDHLHIFAKSRRYGALAFLRAYMILENVNNSDPETNGEYAFLKRNIILPASKDGTLVIFDVGANRGAYSRTVLKLADRNGLKVALHAFEPMQKSYEILRSDPMLHRPHVHLNQYAASSSEKMIPMYADEPESESASMTPRDLRYRGAKFDHAEMIRSLRLDAYIAQRKISKIDFMKIDVEGHELEVLRGLGDFLNPDNIRCIQFEYGGISRTLFDLYDLLEGAGYHIHKMTRNGHLIQKSYNPMMEKFYSNYITQAESAIISTRKSFLARTLLV